MYQTNRVRGNIDGLLRADAKHDKASGDTERGRVLNPSAVTTPRHWKGDEGSVVDGRQQIIQEHEMDDQNQAQSSHLNWRVPL